MFKTSMTQLTQEIKAELIAASISTALVGAVMAYDIFTIHTHLKEEIETMPEEGMEVTNPYPLTKTVIAEYFKIHGEDWFNVWVSSHILTLPLTDRFITPAPIYRKLPVGMLLQEIFPYKK